MFQLVKPNWELDLENLFPFTRILYRDLLHEIIFDKALLYVKVTFNSHA